MQRRYVLRTDDEARTKYAKFDLMTRQEVGEAIGIGLTTVYRLFGGRGVTLRSIRRVADYLEVGILEIAEQVNAQE